MSEQWRGNAPKHHAEGSREGGGELVQFPRREITSVEVNHEMQENPPPESILGIRKMLLQARNELDLLQLNLELEKFEFEQIRTGQVSTEQLKRPSVRLVVSGKEDDSNREENFFKQHSLQAMVESDLRIDHLERMIEQKKQEIKVLAGKLLTSMEQTLRSMHASNMI